MGKINVDFGNNTLTKDSVIVDPSTIIISNEKNTIWCVGDRVIKSGERGRPSGDYYRALSYFKIQNKEKVAPVALLSAIVNNTKVVSPKTPKTPKTVKIEHKVVEYTPTHSYRFEIVIDVAHLYIDNVELAITEDSILKIDPFELYFGVLPAVVNFVHPFLTEEKFISVPPIFRKARVPAIYSDGTRSTIGNTTISLLMLILFYKRVCRSEFVQLCGKTFYLQHSNDTAHCFRNHTDNSLLYILQNSKNNFVSHGYEDIYTDGSYIFYSLNDPRPVDIADRSQKISEADFNIIKLEYANCCALCGNPESDTIKLEQGHIDSHFPLNAPGNCAPHCDSCNQTNKNNMTIKEFVNPLKKRKLAYFTQHTYVKSLFSVEEFFKIQKKDIEKVYVGYTIKLEKI